MGCRTEPAAVHIAHVLQRLHFLQFFNFLHNLHDLPQKKNYTPLPQKYTNSFFFIIHTTYRKKKNYTHLPQKKITRLDDFFVHDLHFSQRPRTFQVSLSRFQFQAPAGFEGSSCGYEHCGYEHTLSPHANSLSGINLFAIEVHSS